MHAPGTAWIRTVLAPVGRIALTNYLAQSVVGIILFTGVGLGLAGRVSPPLLFLLAFVVFTGQVGVSVWWLKSHRYGPAAYLLRWFTTWHRPGRCGLRRPAPSAPASSSREPQGYELHRPAQAPHHHPGAVAARRADLELPP